jgi:hypothetical protein
MRIDNTRGRRRDLGTTSLYLEQALFSLSVAYREWLENIEAKLA